jgi:hypothetical protein
VRRTENELSLVGNFQVASATGCFSAGFSLNSRLSTVSTESTALSRWSFMRVMEELYREGNVRAIGVSNFHEDCLIDLIIHNEVIPALNQIETHRFNQQIENAKFMKVDTKRCRCDSKAGSQRKNYRKLQYL